MRALLLLLVAVLLACPLAAQEPGAQGAGTNEQDRPLDESMGTETAPSAQAVDSPEANNPALESPWKILLYYGADFTELEGYPAGDVGRVSTLASVTARVTVARPRFRTYFGSDLLLQNSSEGTNINGNGFISPVFSSAVALSRRWLWDSSVGLQYGAEAVRLFSADPQSCEDRACPERMTAEQGYFKLWEPSINADAGSSSTLDAQGVGDMPGLARPESLVVRSVTHTSMTLGAYGSTGLTWWRTRGQLFSVRFSHAGNSFLDGNIEGNNAASARVTASRQLMRLTTLSTYGQVHDYLQDNGCTSYGSGMGIWHTMSQRTSWGAEAGPEYGSRACGQRLGANFYGKLRSRISRRASLAVDGGRDLSAFYMAGSRWANYVEGAVIQRTGDSSFFTLSAGYLSSAAEFRPGSTYSGYFLSPQFRWQMNRSWDLLASYRYFHSTSEGNGVGGGSYAVNWIYLTLRWHPPALKL
jgi:hypothetical protein